MKNIKFLSLILIFSYKTTFTIEIDSSSISYTKLIDIKEEKEVKELSDEEVPTKPDQIDNFTDKQLEKHFPKVLTKIILDFANMGSSYNIQYFHEQTINNKSSPLTNLTQLIDGSLISSNRDGNMQLWKKNNKGKFIYNKTMIDLDSNRFPYIKLIQLKNGYIAFIVNLGPTIEIWSRNKNGEYSNFQNLCHDDDNTACCFCAHNAGNCLSDLIQLKDGSLATCSGSDSDPIRIWKIKQNGKYYLFQKLPSKVPLNYLIELEDQTIIACSNKRNINRYILNQNNKYDLLEEFKIETNSSSTITGIIKLINMSFAIGIFENGISGNTRIYKFNQHNTFYSHHIINVYIENTTQLQDESLVTNAGKNITIWKLNRNRTYYSFQLIENAHDKPINKIIELQDSSIASCSYDKIIKIWKLDTNQQYYCYQIINNAHVVLIQSLIRLHEGFASFSTDKTIKIWKPKLVPSETTTVETTPEIQDDAEDWLDKLLN